jgi:hypothetical protein
MPSHLYSRAMWPVAGLAFSLVCFDVLKTVT